MTSKAKTIPTTDAPPDLVAAAWSGVAGHDRLVGVLARLRERLPLLRVAATANRPGVDVIGGVSDSTATEIGHVAALAVIAGEGIPDGLGEQVLDARLARDVAGAEAAALAEVERGVEHALDRLRVEHVDAALGVLRGELGRVLDAARGVLPDLERINSPQGAIDGGAVEQWRTAQGLAVDYAGARDAQLAVTCSALGHRATPADRFQSGGWATHAVGRRLVASFGYVRDAWTIATSEQPALAAPVAGDDPAGVVRWWPMASAVLATAERLPWLTGDPLNDLRAAVRLDAWLPDLGELYAAASAADAEHSPPAAAEPINMVGENLMGDERPARFSRWPV